MGSRFEPGRFVAKCRAALAGRAADKHVCEIVARAVRHPLAVLAGLGEPKRAAMQRLYHGPGLTILNVVWGPMMTVLPHEHAMWAVIGVYTGREDNIFWRRVSGSRKGRIEAAGAKALVTGDAELLPRDIVHSVTNPIGRLTGAIHVYGGDFFGVPRSEWDPETLYERPFDPVRAVERFEEANAASAG
jgi:predicted metal-dependent enzyme (double-stranded beta helix superfamily)